MSNRFHSKWHRTSHQTYKNPDILDAGWDPIASHDVPFSGDFVMAPSVSGWCISAEKNRFEDIYAWSPSSVITINAHYDPSTIPDPDPSTINLVAGTINFNVNETDINGHLNVKDWVEISGDSTKDGSGYGLLVHKSAVISGETSAVGKVTIDDNLYVTGAGEGCGSAYFNAISATEATIVSALIKEVDISASESNGYIMKTPNPQGKIIPNPLPGTGDAGKNNFYLSGDTLYSDSWGYFEGELKTASALYADGPVTFADTLNVSANANIKGNTDIGGTLGVTGAVDFDSTLNVDGATTLNTLSVTNNTTVGGTLGVTGATTLSTLNATGAVDFDSTLNVDGATTLNSLGVTNNTTVGGTLGVTGATTLSGTLKAGATTLNSVHVTGAAEIDDALTVWGPAKLHTLVVDHQATIKESLGVNEEICVYDDESSSVKIDKFGFSICPPSTVDSTDWYKYCFRIVLGSGTNLKELRLRYDPMYGSWEFLNGSHLYIPNSGGTLARIEDIDSSLTSYATKQYVDDKIGDINTILDEINGEAI